MDNYKKIGLLISLILLVVSSLAGLFIKTDTTTIIFYAVYYLLLLSILAVSISTFLLGIKSVFMPFLIFSLLFYILSVWLEPSSFYYISAPYLFRYIISLTLIHWIKVILEKKIFNRWIGIKSWDSLVKMGYWIFYIVNFLCTLVFILSPITTFLYMNSNSFNLHKQILYMDKFLFPPYMIVLIIIQVITTLADKGKNHE